MLEGGYKIKFDNDCVTKALSQIIYSYFYYTNIKWW